MHSIENLRSRVTFGNEPKQSEQEADKKFNERRLSLVPHIKEFASTHALFKGREIRITFASRGISSLVSVLETSEGKTILKIPLSPDYAPGEGQFLEAWENAGVEVPHVIETGTIDTQPYILMEYVDAPVLGEQYSNEEMLENGAYIEMGRTLKRMHTPSAVGYGRVVEGKSEFHNFLDWIDSEDMQRRIKYVMTNDLLPREICSFSDVREVLLRHIEKHPESSYCHDDFGSYNLFATEPITVFDPNPRFNNGYIDLGRSIAIHIAHGAYSKESLAQIIEGYFAGEPYDEKALQATVILGWYMKFPYWHKTKRNIMIQRAVSYIKENMNVSKTQTPADA